MLTQSRQMSTFLQCHKSFIQIYILSSWFNCSVFMFVNFTRSMVEKGKKEIKLS